MGKLIKRPRIISVLCVIGFILILISFPGVFSPEVKNKSIFLPALYGILIAGNFISMVGIWYMKRWGVQWFTALFFLKICITLLFDDVSVVGTFLSFIGLIFFVFFYKRMDLNL